MYIYICMYIYVYICICIYIYTISVWINPHNGHIKPYEFNGLTDTPIEWDGLKAVGAGSVATHWPGIHGRHG